MLFHWAVPEDENYSQREPVPARLQWVEEYIQVGGDLGGSRPLGSLCEKGDGPEGVIGIMPIRSGQQWHVHVSACSMRKFDPMDGSICVLLACGRCIGACNLRGE